MQESSMFGLKFIKAEMYEVIKYMSNKIDSDSATVVQTVNVDHLCIREKDGHFRQSMERADLLLADGMPLVWYSKLVRDPLPERVTGVDLAYKICEVSRGLGFRIFLLGARPGIAEKAIYNLEQQYRGVHICGYYSPSREEILDPIKSMGIISRIKDSNANVLLVAFGAPLQEVWLNQYRDQLVGVVSIGVGATIDFMAGSIKRAPTWIQSLGFEWLFRLLSEPKRLFKRYMIQDLRFLKICALDLLNRRQFTAD